MKLLGIIKFSYFQFIHNKSIIIISLLIRKKRANTQARNKNTETICILEGRITAYPLWRTVFIPLMRF